MRRSRAAKRWAEKGALLTDMIKDEIADLKLAGEVKDDYRGLEHEWYGVWECVHAEICHGKRTLLATSQPRVTRTLKNPEGKEITQERIPDFALVRVIGCRTVQRPGSNRKLKLEPIKKYVALMENKCLPAYDTEPSRMHGLLEARLDLVEQVRVFFGGDRSTPDSEKAVIGISAAGDWWAWELFTADDVLALSENQDTTYVPKDEVLPPTSTAAPAGFQLYTRRGRKEMSAMMEAIKALPSSKHFGDKL